MNCKYLNSLTHKVVNVCNHCKQDLHVIQTSAFIKLELGITTRCVCAVDRHKNFFINNNDSLFRST